jgi:hypothetical protein
VGGIIPLRRATSSRYDGRLGQESAQLTQASNKAIARRLGISFHTAKFHVAAILAKLNAALLCCLAQPRFDEPSILKGFDGGV